MLSTRSQSTAQEKLDGNSIDAYDPRKMQTGQTWLVVGGGIAGLCVAWWARRKGCRIALIDPDRPTQAATWASGGMLIPKGESASDDLLRQTYAALASTWQLIETVEQTAKTEIHRGRGIFLPYFSRFEAARLRRTAGIYTRMGYPGEDLPPAQLPTPLRQAGADGAVYYPDEGFVDPRELYHGLRRCLKHDDGVELHFGRQVEQIDETDNGVHATLDDGSTLTGDAAVMAAGLGQRRLTLAGQPRWTEVDADRGIMLRLATQTRPPGIVFHYTHESTTYIIPDRHGVRLGSTTSMHDRRRDVGDKEQARLLAAGARVWPPLADAPVREAVVGFRPKLALSDLPYADRIPDSHRIWMLNGLHRNGILLAAPTARDLVERMIAA